MVVAGHAPEYPSAGVQAAGREWALTVRPDGPLPHIQAGPAAARLWKLSTAPPPPPLAKHLCLRGSAAPAATVHTLWLGWAPGWGPREAGRDVPLPPGWAPRCPGCRPPSLRAALESKGEQQLSPWFLCRGPRDHVRWPPWQQRGDPVQWLSLHTAPRSTSHFLVTCAPENAALCLLRNLPAHFPRGGRDKDRPLRPGAPPLTSQNHSSTREHRLGLRAREAASQARRALQGCRGGAWPSLGPGAGGARSQILPTPISCLIVEIRQRLSQGSGQSPGGPSCCDPGDQRAPDAGSRRGQGTGEHCRSGGCWPRRMQRRREGVSHLPTPRRNLAE
ncbi:uncharacterized protein LOC116741349 [Phocoena sinus]|uniref:uncharacterized protein LOC116741349 n=1 Tax=Phocoena sinus TaxID=42100 RepID=UPI0013C41C30|nr:uncharacterized protein LOC116741349 [Phocoena sinus]